MALDTLFESIYIINLDHRTDRWQRISEQLNSMGIHRFERFAAVTFDDDNLQHQALLVRMERFARGEQTHMAKPTVACLLSHVQIVQLAKERGQQQILICEDDCELLPEFLARWPQAEAELNQLDWDMIFIGGKRAKGVKGESVSRHWERLTTSSL